MTGGGTVTAGVSGTGGATLALAGGGGAASDGFRQRPFGDQQPIARVGGAPFGNLDRFSGGTLLRLGFTQTRLGSLEHLAPRGAEFASRFAQGIDLG